ncbi:TPA: GNAT family N-acetyltransferase [Candidatus Berkelbacteria bacterium]|uniref:N-acetyltransferase domain-containing protein n=1 Tax=Berkelbacteria bacterium GW2011_GWE1_39_12 TaxID=1618337 RepID=A0A0G4B3C7_9BACT|nr:MAG: hypothetical protein UT28_C0001G0269 [Berkelbacteria bacterium GW2011_GWE1_39_12]HBO60665.1 GNAT family N-acetyltransferase [Candidatus Berkelbacteria bacterium]
MTEDEKEIAEQIASLINPEASRSNMLPRKAEEIHMAIQKGRGFVIAENGMVICFVAIYEWPRYLEIGSVVTREEYRRRGYASRLINEAVTAAKLMGDKPIIALTNPRSTRLFEALGFRHKPRKDEVQNGFWEPCKQTCIDYGRWPKCHCTFMQFFRSE